MKRTTIERNAEICVARWFGLLTYKEIAERFGISRERARQVALYSPEAQRLFREHNKAVVELHPGKLQIIDKEPT